MIERIPGAFHPFVLPFVFGMLFVLTYCLVGMIRVFFELPREDRKRFLISLVTPKTIWKNIKDIFLNCLIHVKLWKRNKVLGYMHSSIAFGWFMLILLGHIEVMLFLPHRVRFFYYPIFFNFFVAEADATIQGKVLMFLMDISLLFVLSGILLAIYKRFRSRFFGMRRTTRPSFLDRIAMYALWAIFPLRLLAETFTAHISGGSFLTEPAGLLFHRFISNDIHVLPTWWAYSIALCIFMVLLPFTRYMHIPAEMLLIPMRNAGIKIRHPRKGFAKLEYYTCPNCGVCIDACPMSVRKENLKDCTVYLNRQLRRGNERRIAQISDKCLLCGKCSAVCQVGVQGPELRLAQRELRPYALTPDYSAIDTASMQAAVSAKPAKVLYFAGCMTALTPGIRRATETLLKAAGIDYQLMDPEGGLCCGRPLMMAGRKEAAQELIRKNVEIIRASGCDTLLLTCPICYRVFLESYPLEGIRVVHHTVFLEELMREGRLPVEYTSGSYVFHDSCELGRGCGIYEEPRAALRRIGFLHEAEKHHAESICCGGSLGSLSLGFEKRKDITMNALHNLTANDPETIVTACPLCRSTFARYADRPVEDLSEVLVDHLKSR